MASPAATSDHTFADLWPVPPPVTLALKSFVGSSVVAYVDKFVFTINTSTVSDRVIITGDAFIEFDSRVDAFVPVPLVDMETHIAQTTSQRRLWRAR